MNFIVLYNIPSLDEIELKILENSYEEKLISAIDMSDGRMMGAITDLSTKIDRSMLAFERNLETTKPMKSNNWDSIREAFKGPTKVDRNDRD